MYYYLFTFVFEINNPITYMYSQLYIHCTWIPTYLFPVRVDVHTVPWSSLGMWITWCVVDRCTRCGGVHKLWQLGVQLVWDMSAPEVPCPAHYIHVHCMNGTPIDYCSTSSGSMCYPFSLTKPIITRVQGTHNPVHCMHCARALRWTRMGWPYECA